MSVFVTRHIVLLFYFMYNVIQICYGRKGASPFPTLRFVSLFLFMYFLSLDRHDRNKYNLTQKTIVFFVCLYYNVYNYGFGE